MIYYYYYLLSVLNCFVKVNLDYSSTEGFRALNVFSIEQATVKAKMSWTL